MFPGLWLCSIQTFVKNFVSNLSHVRLQNLIQNLTGSGLINKIEYDKKSAFVITEKGRLFLEEYKRFSDLAGSFGLEL